MSLLDSKHAETVTAAEVVTTSEQAIERSSAALAMAEEKAELGAVKSCALYLSLSREYRALAKVLAESKDNADG